MTEFTRYGDIAGVILDEWDQDAQTFGRATTRPPSEEEQKNFRDALPAVGAAAVQAGMQAFPQLRALSSTGRGLLTLAGGGGGAAGGEALRQQYAGEPYDAEKMAQAGIENIMFDVGGNVVFRYGGKLVTIPYQKVRKFLNKDYGDPVQGSVDEAAVAAQKWLQERNKEVTLTKYQAAPTKSRELQEGIARASVLSGGGVRALDDAQINVIKNEVDKLTSQATQMSREEFGEQFKGVIESGEEALSKYAKARYEAIDNLGYGVSVNLAGVKGQARLKLKDLKTLASAPENQAFLQQQILGIQKSSLTFAEARAKLSDLKAFQRSLEKSDPRQKLVGDAVTQIENAMENSAKRGGREVYDFYRQVNEEYKNAAKAFRSDILLDAMSKNPERVGEYFFRNGNVTEIKSAYRALQQVARRDVKLAKDVGQMVENFQQAYIRGIFGSITDEKSLKKALQYAKDERETLQTVLGGAGQFKGVTSKSGAVEAMLNAMEYSAKRPDSVMSLFIASKEAGGLSQLVTGTLAAGTSIVAALPTIFARSAADPRRVNELLQINKQSLKVGFTDQVASKLVQLAQDLGIELSDFVSTQEPTQATPAQSQVAPAQQQGVDISDLLQGVR